MRTGTVRWRFSTPLAEQVRHGFSMVLPRPPQARQGDENENGPWFSSTTPRPPQTPQVRTPVPGAAPEPEQVEQRSSLMSDSEVVTPRTASANSRVSRASRSSPRRGPTPEEPRERPPEPNICPNRSPKPDMSAALKENPPAFGPRRRTSSYSARFFSSPSTS